MEFTVLDQTRFFLSTGEIQSLTGPVNLLQEHGLTQPFCIMEFSKQTMIVESWGANGCLG